MFVATEKSENRNWWRLLGWKWIIGRDDRRENYKQNLMNYKISKHFK